MTETANKSDPLVWSVDQYLSQGVIWLTSRNEKGFVFVADMDAGYRAQATQWLDRHAMPLISLVENERHDEMLYNGKGTLAGVLDLVTENPKIWVKTTTLYRALTADAPNER